VLGLWWWSRTSELFTVWVRNGQVVRVRGRIPAGLLSDMKDIVRKPPVRAAKIRAVKEADAARLVASGIDEGRTQRLRNCFRLYTIARLRQAPIVEKPTFWQAVSLASLVAWIFDRML
jgi:Protein of unknown function (DUF3634)